MQFIAGRRSQEDDVISGRLQFSVYGFDKSTSHLHQSLHYIDKMSSLFENDVIIYSIILFSFLYVLHL